MKSECVTNKLVSATALLITSLLVISCRSSDGASIGSETQPVAESNVEEPNTDAGSNASNQVLSAGSCANSIVSVDITTPTVRQNTDSACDYYISSFVSGTSSLTIEPGTVIMMGSDAEFSLVGGSLNAVGTPEQRIVFLGQQALQGYWQGIRLVSLRASQLGHVDIQDGGNNSPIFETSRAGLSVQGSTISLVDVTISNSFVSGARIDENTTITEFADNQFFGNALEGLSISSHLVDQLDTNTDYIGTVQPNGDAYINVNNIGEFSNNPTTWKKLNAPYKASSILISDNDELRIEAGVELQIETQIWAFDNGTFTTLGRLDEPVMINQARGLGLGSWIGIRAGNAGSVDLEHTIVDGGFRGLFVETDAIARVSNTRFQNSEEWGIDCDSPIALGNPPVLELGNGISFENNGMGDIDPDCPL